MQQLPTSPFSGIFVSYRRDDSSGHAGRLSDRLVNHFGKDRIFMDIDTIEPGEDFVAAIENAVSSCAILIAIIGRHWLSGSSGATGRLDNPNDVVRLEIATALSRDIRVIPVLVQRATMPKQEDLPENLAKLTRRNAVELSDLRWQTDVDQLIGVLERILGKREEAARLAEAERQAQEERLRQEEEAIRREEQEKQRRGEEEEAKQRVTEARRGEDEEYQHREEEEKRHVEDEKQVRLAEEAKQRAAEARRQEGEIEHKEVEEQARYEASRRLAEEERAQAYTERRKLAEEEAERLRLEAERKTERHRLDMKKQARAEEESIKQEEEARQRDAERALQANREAEQSNAQPVTINSIPVPGQAAQLSDGHAMGDASDATLTLLREDSSNRTILLVIIACVAVLGTIAFIWMKWQRQGSEHQSATTQQTAQTASVLPTATPTQSATPEPIPTPDKATFEKSLTAFIKNDKDMKHVIDGTWKTDEVRENRKFTYGDLDGDGAEDAALWFCGENMAVGQNYWCKLMAFRNMKGVLTYAASKSWYQNRWEWSYLHSITPDGKIIITNEQQEVGNASSPITKSQTKIVFDGNKLKEHR